MKKRKLLIYDPFLDTLGGGERYILTIAKIFDELGIEVVLTSLHPVSEKDINSRFGMTFNNLTIIPNVFRNTNFVKKSIYTSDFDYFLYVTDGSYFFSLAKRNYIYAMVPQKILYKRSLLNKTKTWNYRFLTHSQFVKNSVDRWTGKNSILLYPPIQDELITKAVNKKEQILSVGRFFKHLHSKRQDILIESFKKLKQTSDVFKDFKLILAGGLKEEDKSYIEELKKLAGGDGNIIFITNPNFSQIRKLYEESSLYWHATGFEIDEDKHPELVEHLGITPLEAMAAGCIVFCHNSGGPKELIQNGIEGFLYNTETELVDATIAVMSNESIQQKVRSASKMLISDTFSYDTFKKRVVRDFKLST